MLILNVILQVGPETTSTEVQCLCNHLTSFAAQVLLEPNIIDFRKALRGFVELSENPMVFILVLSILGVYILLLIWARRRDIHNAKKVHIVYPLFPPLPSPPLLPSYPPPPRPSPPLHPCVSRPPL